MPSRSVSRFLSVAATLVALVWVSRAAAGELSRDTAIAACKQHVESMLKESAETRYAGEPELKIQPGENGDFDVTGWVTSTLASGRVRRGDFVCHARRGGSSLWTTKTQLAIDP